MLCVDFVRRRWKDRSLNIHFFSAAIARQTYAGSQLESLASILTGGSFAPVTTHLVEGNKLSREDLAQLRAILDEGLEKEDEND